MSNKTQRTPKPEIDYSAELWKTLKRQVGITTGVVTDAELNKVTNDGKTDDGRILLLCGLLDKKKVKFTDFFGK